MPKTKKYGLVGEVAWGIGILFWTLLSLSIVALMLWIPIHFIIKYW